MDKEAGLKNGIVFDRPLREAAKQTEPETPVVALLPDFVREGCAEYLK